ncbi:Hypothetical predicted protein [Octopus vulgaris]|uniref:Uncharacterized protein n=1 Tax=Octopus vulgaris TaxID=6645 RepID=A0AA36BLT5_OCTVU|nr:Hypothetical predicted protein [Octopus vulgaris]
MGQYDMYQINQPKEKKAISYRFHLAVNSSLGSQQKLGGGRGGSGDALLLAVKSPYPISLRQFSSILDELTSDLDASQTNL